MAKYSHSFENKTLSTTADTFTHVTTATGAGSVIRVYELLFGGEAGSSSVCRVAINRPTVGTTPTTQTPEKLDPASPSASSSVATTWSVQPTLSTNDVLVPTFNAFGGVVRWVAAPDSEVVVGSQGAVANLSCRSRSGTGLVSGHVLFEER
jgi:hypothetical protein